MRIPLGLIFAHTRRNWFRSILTLASVFVAIFTFGALQAVVESLRVTVSGVGSTRLISESAASLFVTLPKKLEQQIATVPNAKQVTHFTWFGGLYISEKFFFARFGVDPLAFRDAYTTDLAMPEDQWQKFAKTRTGCIIGADLAARFGWDIGSTVPLKGNIFPGDYKLEVVGIYKSLSPSYDQSTLYMQWDYLNEVSKQSGGPADVVSIFITVLDDPNAAATVSAQVDDLFANSGTRTRTMAERAFQAQFVSMWGGLPTFFNFLSIVAIAATFLVTLNTMLLNVRERVKETGVLKTLGFTDTTVVIISLLESLFVCALGGGLAIPLITGMNGKVLPVVLLPLYVPTSAGYVMGGIALGLGICAGLLPALGAGRLKIVDALRRRG